MGEQILISSASINKKSRVSDLESQITDKTIFQINKSFNLFRTEQIERKEELSQKQQQLKSQITNLKQNLDKLQGVVSEIKTSGKQYHNFTICPLNCMVQIY